MSILPAPGVHAIDATDYHADTIADQPTLSASIAAILCAQTPAHARVAHPKLNPNIERKDETKFDFGQAAHSLLLEGLDRVHIVGADNWTTKAAREERDVARAHGMVPLLAKDGDRMRRMADAVREQLDPPLLVDGKPEQTLVWEEPNGVVCRARLDWLRDDMAAVFDLKTTSRSAQPRQYERALCGVGGDVQAAMYLRGLAAVTGAREWADFAWIVVETAAPFALSVIRPASDLLELGDRKARWAIRVFGECLASGEWPAYGREVVWAHAPEWEIARWLEREELEQVA